MLSSLCLQISWCLTSIFSRRVQKSIPFRLSSRHNAESFHIRPWPLWSPKLRMIPSGSDLDLRVPPGSCPYWGITSVFVPHRGFDRCHQGICTHIACSIFSKVLSACSRKPNTMDFENSCAPSSSSPSSISKICSKVGTSTFSPKSKASASCEDKASVYKAWKWSATTFQEEESKTGQRRQKFGQDALQSWWIKAVGDARWLKSGRRETIRR